MTPQSGPDLQEFTMLTMLLQLMVILRNKNGDATMHDYVDGSDESEASPPESDFTPLDALSAIFVRDKEVIATCHQGIDERRLILVDENFPSYNQSIITTKTTVLQSLPKA